MYVCMYANDVNAHGSLFSAITRLAEGNIARPPCCCLNKLAHLSSTYYRALFQHPT